MESDTGVSGGAEVARAPAQELRAPKPGTVAAANGANGGDTSSPRVTEAAAAASQETAGSEAGEATRVPAAGVGVGAVATAESVEQGAPVESEPAEPAAAEDMEETVKAAEVAGADNAAD